MSQFGRHKKIWKFHYTTMKVGPYTNCMVQASNIKSEIFSNIMTGQYFITTVRDHILQWHHIDAINVCGITPVTLLKGDWTICTVHIG